MGIRGRSRRDEATASPPDTRTRRARERCRSGEIEWCVPSAQVESSRRVSRVLVLFLVVLALAGISSLAYALRPTHATGARALGLAPSAPLVRFSETGNGCNEVHPHGARDVDPSSLHDQENDECFPLQHVARQPDGRPIGASASSG